jgi:hypothetical protein
MRSRFPFNLIPDSVGDRLMAGAWGLKIELLKFKDDEGSEDCSCEIEMRSTIEGEPAELLADLLRSFRTPRTEGGAA